MPMNIPTVHIFIKANCPSCAQAKRILSNAGLPYIQYDVKIDKRNADASIYFSGMTTVPQIFLGNYHISGAEELERLHASGRLIELAQATADSWLPLDVVSDDEIAWGAEDIPLRTIIPESDGSHSSDPEEWSILHFYKEWVGLWPNWFYYQYHWPEAYKLFVYCHNFIAVMGARKILGKPLMMATGFAAAHAHGCTYCQVHTTVAEEEASMNPIRTIERARPGDIRESNLFRSFELALANLAANATTNTVTPAQLRTIVEIASQTGISQSKVYIMWTAMRVTALGFLNVFNDLSGVEIETKWAAKAKESIGLEPGRHGVGHGHTSTNLNNKLPQGGPTIKDMIVKYQTIVAEAGGTEAYAARELGLVPSWIRAWPKQMRACHIYFYTEIMQERDHSLLPSELKHLMARVSAIAKGHSELAAIEGYLAYQVTNRTLRNIERIRHCYDVACDRNPGHDLFSESECAALQVAWLSAQTPLITPRRFIQPAIDAYTPTALVHLFTVCSLASLIQRFVAIVKPPMDPEVRRFLDRHSLTSDTLAIRYPMPNATHMVAA